MLSDEHKRKRVDWAREQFARITDSTAPVAFLDEKWFYTTNCRRLIKVLPPGEAEQLPADFEASRRAAQGAPKIQSRRYPVKVMYLGVVLKSHYDHDFDGRILLERVLQTKTLTRSCRNKNFIEDVHVNE